MTSHRAPRSRRLAVAVLAAAGVGLVVPAAASAMPEPIAPSVSPAVASGAASSYQAVTPFTAYAARHRVVAGHKVAVPLAGRGGLPAAGHFDAVAVSMMVSSATRSATATVSAGGGATPARVVSAPAKRTASGFTVVPVSSTGAIQARLSGGSARLRIVVEGYQSQGRGEDTFHPLAPATVLVPHRVGAGKTRSLTVVGAPRTGLPPNGHVAAVALAVTAGRPSRTTTVSAYPRGGSSSAGQPVVSARHDLTTSGVGVVTVGRHGDVTLRNAHGHATLSAQVEGYWTTDPTGSSFRSVRPTEISDAPTVANAWRTVRVTGQAGVPSASRTAGVLLSITAGSASRDGYLAVAPTRQGFPSSGPVSVPAHTRVTTAVVARLTGSSLHIYSNRRMPLAVSVVGWYGDPASGRDVDAAGCPPSFASGDGFAVIRATDGKPYNSSSATCFDQEVTAAGQLPAAPEYYMNLADPGTASSHWHQGGPKACHVAHNYDVGCAYDYGYQAAAAAVDFARVNRAAAGSRWWVDVETDNTWGGPRRAPGHRAANTADIQGALRYLDSHGHPAGVYTETAWWGPITGTPKGFSQVPVWGGGADSPSNARANCRPVSITGGPALLAQWFTTPSVDHDVAC